jgi:signal transduction histidine kinase/putative methionine-R-sulfoxide reductase with GAF domain
VARPDETPETGHLSHGGQERHGVGLLPAVHLAVMGLLTGNSGIGVVMPSEVSTAGADQDRGRTLEELERELSEAHRREAATAEVLRVIGSSPTNVQPVFDLIVRNAVRLCNGLFSTLFQFDGELIHQVAQHNYTPEALAVLHRTFPTRPTRDLWTGQAILERTVIQILDVEAEPEYQHQTLARAIGWRSGLHVPMLREGVPVGVIFVARARSGRFSDNEIELLKTFADQAVIAIENTRLFNELRESLQQQTATSEVLQVISTSHTTVQPVLDAVVASAGRLCEAAAATIYLRDADVVMPQAHSGPLAVQPIGQRIPLSRQWVTGRAVLEARTVHVTDLTNSDDFPEGRAMALELGHRATLGVPLLREGAAIGAILVRRREARSFTDKQIALVENFAAHVAIAIENTRLFGEVRAQTRNLSLALQRQTATSEILGIISASPGQLEPVFNAILERARELCAAKFGHLLLLDGQVWRAAALHNVPPAYADFWRSASPAALRVTLLSRLLETKQPYQVEDLRLSEAYRMRVPLTAATVELAGARTLLGVPLVKDDLVIGAIVLYRTEVHPFDERQIALLSSFTDQAVIAIENTRLFEEVRARTRELVKTVEDLEIASQHKNQFVANMSHELRTPLAAILGYAELMQEGFYEPLGQKSLDALTRIRSNGRHLLGLINTVLDIAKIESGQFTLNIAEYAIESVVETVRSATESLAQNKKLALKTEVAKSLPIGLGDEQRLTQVLLNLVGNAIKFTDAGEVRVSAMAANSHFTVTVADTGPGIPETHLARIFEQFHQVDSSNTKAKGGTGLGLAIAREIVEMHGGRIWVESALGKGSTFQMELPIRAEFRKRTP